MFQQPRRHTVVAVVVRSDIYRLLSAAVAIFLCSATSAVGALIPSGVQETPTEVHWSFSWEEDGNEEILLTSESGDWRVFLSVYESMQSGSPSWTMVAFSGFSPFVENGPRLVISSGLAEDSFATDESGTVVNTTTVTYRGFVGTHPPIPVDLVPDGGSLTVSVEGRDLSGNPPSSSIHIAMDVTGVIPEPSSATLMLFSCVVACASCRSRLHDMCGRLRRHAH